MQSEISRRAALATLAATASTPVLAGAPLLGPIEQNMLVSPSPPSVTRRVTRFIMSRATGRAS